MDEGESPFSIEIVDQYGRLPLDIPTLRRVVEVALRHCDCPRASVEVALVDDARIEQLNNTYLRHSGPTDCITFNLAESGEDIDGQIVVSCETALREADARGHTPQAEVFLYVVHGTLHLLGWDDATREQAQRMHEMEDRVLTEAGVGPVFAKKTA